jgi:hypothetical protein
MKIPKFNIDSVERVLADNANKLEALKSAYAARLEKQRLNQDRTPDDQSEQEASKQGRSASDRGRKP